MDKQFTIKLQEWMNTPAEERDYEQGALFLLQLTNNKILYRNISRDPKRHAEFIEFKIKRYLQYRLQDLTHEQVQDMQRKVDSIAAEHALVERYRLCHLHIIGLILFGMQISRHGYLTLIHLK